MSSSLPKSSYFFPILISEFQCKRGEGPPSKHLGNNYRYIEGYAKSANLSPYQGCMRIIRDVEQVLTLILEWKGREQLGEPKMEGRGWEESKLVELRP
jgi:hypothetical protein